MADPAPRRITVLGDGQMALVCAQILTGADDADRPADGGPPAPEVVLWGHDAGALSRLAQTRKSPRLEHLMLADEVRVEPDDASALDGADMVLMAIPAQYIRGVMERLGPHVPEGAGFVSVSKGVENKTLLRPLEVIASVLDEGAPASSSGRPCAVLSGPTIAAELARCLPATMIAAGADGAFAERVREAFSTRWLRVYTGNDPIGVEVAGALKNVIAIAAGILDGLQAGYNAKSALLARGLAEITRLGVALGADRETFFGVAGVGDLATTCFSPLGRNRSCGEELGRGRSLDEVLEESSSVVEGVATTRSVVELAERLGVEMPITAAVHAVLYEGLDPIEGIARLMSREPKEERVG